MEWKNSITPASMPPALDADTQDQVRAAVLDSQDQQSLAARARLLILIFVVIMSAVVFRMARFQILDRLTPPLPAPQQVLKANLPRGRIVDQHGLLMATDDYVLQVYANPHVIASSVISQSVMFTLTEVLGISSDELEAGLAANEKLVTLNHGATPAQCDTLRAKVRDQNLAWCDRKLKRVHPQGRVAAEVVGFTDYDHNGAFGIEAKYQKWLSKNEVWPAKDPPGELGPMPDAWKTYLPSPARRDLVLHINAPLQYLVEKHLREGVAEFAAEGGTIIIMDPRTGGILAMATYPTFDPDRFGVDDSHLLINSSVIRVYEPGSVFKLVTMAAALDTGYMTPDTLFRDTGSLTVSSEVIKNAEEKVYGEITARDALASSVNVISARISIDLQADFYQYVRRFGFGKITEVDLISESKGIVKEPGTPNWSMSDQATNSYGQGISVTGLQMINSVAAIANKGTMLQPQIVRAMTDGDKVYYIQPRVIGNPIQPETARQLTEMMVYTVQKASYANILPGYRLAGKTGTADIPTQEGYTLPETITSFIGFLPADEPELVIMVRIDRPKESRWAEQVAVPVFKKVAEDAIRIEGIKPR